MDSLTNKAIGSIRICLNTHTLYLGMLLVKMGDSCYEGTRWDDSVRHAQVSHAPRSAKYLSAVGCVHCII